MHSVARCGRLIYIDDLWEIMTDRFDVVYHWKCLQMIKIKYVVYYLSRKRPVLIAKK